MPSVSPAALSHACQEAAPLDAGKANIQMGGCFGLRYHIIDVFLGKRCWRAPVNCHISQLK
jgi:hypothetical protein